MSSGIFCLDLLIVDIINYFFRIVTQIQELPLNCFLGVMESSDSTFQALYTLSSILTAGVLIVTDSSETGSTEPTFNLTRNILDEYLIVCSKITLHAYQRCCDAILSATKPDDGADSMSIYLQVLSPRKKQISKYVMTYCLFYVAVFLALACRVMLSLK